MDDFIYIQAAMRFMGQKHYRTFRNWCKGTGLEIFKNIGSRRKYVIRSQFIHARFGELIQTLKNRHGENWLEVFKLHLDGNVSEIIRIEEEKKEKIEQISIANNTMQGHEMEYLSRLHEKIREL